MTNDKIREKIEEILTGYDRGHDTTCQCSKCAQVKSLLTLIQQQVSEVAKLGIEAVPEKKRERLYDQEFQQEHNTEVRWWNAARAALVNALGKFIV